MATATKRRAARQAGGEGGTQLPAKRILQLLEPGQAPEVRKAAALVIGEAGVREPELAEALCERLSDPDPQLRLEVIRAVGKLRVDAALPQLLARIPVGGPEAEESARAAARLGARGTRGLHELMPKVAPGLRRYIAAALASDGASGGAAETATMLLDKDPGVVEAAVRSLGEQIPALDRGRREALSEELLSLAKDRKHPLPPATEASVLRLLAALDDPDAAAALWDRITPSHPPEVRAAALQALGKFAAAPGKDQLKRLFACAADPEFGVAAPALVMLQKLPVNDRTAAEWLTLLHAPDVAVRRLALEKIGDRDTADVAAALVDQLSHPDRALRDQALNRLTRQVQGRKVLTAALLASGTPDDAWPLARAQAPFVKEYPSTWREEVFKHVCKHLEANDRLAEPLLFLLREAGAADLRDRLEERALAWRKKKAYPVALLYLRLLARDPSVAFPTRLELALCGLKVSPKDLAADARSGDPCLGQFTHLAQQDEAELFKQVEKVKWLDPDDLYYLGFHFAEKEGRPKQFGGDVLRLVLKRSARSKLGQAAKSKLKASGLG